ncbi:MAG: HisA/HisF-related TIM barrel protein [Anaerovoracaceae bacterium]
MSTKTKFMGLSLKNPVIVAAGPWTRGHKRIKRVIEAGAAAVITESIVLEQSNEIRPRFAYNGMGVQNIKRYSGISLEKWIEELKLTKGYDGHVIANIMAQTPSEMSYLASKMEKTGVSALELGLSVPFSEGMEVIASNAEKVYQLTKGAVSAVDIPVMVKLSQNTTNISMAALAAESAGADGISAIDTVRCIMGVDINTGKPTLSSYGGYSGPAIKPIALAAAAGIAQTTKIPVCGVGGISNYEDILEFIMLGASAVQLGTKILVDGAESITEIVDGYTSWLTANGVDSIDKIKGIALKQLKQYEDIKNEILVAITNEEQCKVGCRNCIKACIENAIYWDKGSITIEKKKCSGCGLCIQICEKKKISLEIFE